MNKQYKTNKFLRETGVFILDILYNAAVIIILVVLIRSFLISPFRVIGSSMMDTLHNKEFILINKLSYILGDIDRGDPIVFLPPATSKDTPKFEEIVTIDNNGVGKLDISELYTNKKANYCNGNVLSSFFFCKEKVKMSDLIYYAPLKNSIGSSSQANWDLVKTKKITKSDIKNKMILFDGDLDQNYVVRIYSSKGEEYFVKRIIGIPGDTIKIDNGRVYLKTKEDDDFHEIDESFLNQENLHHTYINQRQRQNVYEVPEGYYFTMGDNREHSNDSRSWLEPITQEAFPFVPEENISGKVAIVLWPVQSFRLIHSADL